MDRVIEKKNNNNTNLKILWISISIFIISFLAFQNNSLKIADQVWFENFSSTAEQYVLDGILNANQSKPFASAYLGNFTRPLEEYQNKNRMKYFKDGNTQGEFKRYRSQYGLQVKLYSFLFHKNLSINTIKIINSTTFALIISLFYFVLVKARFSNIGSLFACLSISLSPWVIVFSNNLFWVPFTWFLPPLIASFLISTRIDSKFQDIYFFLFLFLAFIFKFLSGYEYITSVYFFTLSLTIFISRNINYSFGYILKKTISISLSFIFAFSASLYFHINQLKSEGLDGINFIKTTALKRSSSKKPTELYEYICLNYKSEIEIKECIKGFDIFSKSLQSNRLEVLTRYIAMPNYFPWVSGRFGDEIKVAFRSYLRSISYGEKINQKEIYLFNTRKNLLDLFFKFISFLGLPLSISFVIYNYRKRPTALVALVISFSSPLSWFMMAKGHSYIHYHLNYIVLYFGFIPTLIYLISDKIYLKLIRINT